MTRDITQQGVTRQILHIIPLIMGIVAAEVRRSEPSVAPAHFRLLGLLNRRPRSLSELAERQGVSLPTISNSVSTLVERGWVTRQPSPDDRRVMIVELTPLGKQVLAGIHICTEARLSEMLARLSQDELDKLNEGLEILESILPDTLRPPVGK